MEKIIILISLLLISGCLVVEQEMSEPIEIAEEPEEALAILVVPTSVEPGQEFEMTWEVHLDEAFDTGIAYDADTQVSDYYAYEFTTDLSSSNVSGAFTASIVAFEEGQVFMRPYATSAGQLYYGEEVSVPIIIRTD